MSSYEQALADGLYRNVNDLLAERDALRAVLKEIVEAYDNTYEAELHGDTWRGAASIDALVMERAAALVGAK